MALRGFLNELPDGLLYHYTDANGLIGILQNKEIWASSAMHLNDAMEIREGAKLLEKYIRDMKEDERQFVGGRLRHWIQWVSEEMLVASFSQEGDQLGQWRAYCPQGNGFSIGVDPTYLQLLANRQEFDLLSCLYDSGEKERFLQILATELKNEPLSGDAFHTYWRGGPAALARFKHEAFRQEKEWRVVGRHRHKKLEFRKGRFGVVPYVGIPLKLSGENLKIKRIVVGPNLNPEVAKAAVAKLCVACDVPTPEINSSVVPYRH